MKDTSFDDSRNTVATGYVIPRDAESKIEYFWTNRDEPRLCIASMQLETGHFTPPLLLHGSGVGRTAKEAAIPAFVEAVERHDTATHYDSQFTVATADELEGQALDLNKIPTCSAKERADSRCMLTTPDPGKPIRWVKATTLHNGKSIYVPAVMVYSHAGWHGLQERFWLPISTGCASHSSYPEAAFRALSELVERDAIAITWLQKLALPKIVIDKPGPITEGYWDLFQRCSRDIDYHFFNATTDIGVPTVYGIQVCRFHPHAHTTVACATAATFDEAIAKVMRDFVAFKLSFNSARKIPADTKHFRGLLDGATFMARAENSKHFQFLLSSERSVALTELSARHNRITGIGTLLERFNELGMEVIIADLTTDMSLRAGLCTLRAVVPALQPMSVHSSAQYRANARLYKAPQAMGYPVRTESELNEWPQPFA